MTWPGSSPAIPSTSMVDITSLTEPLPSSVDSGQVIHRDDHEHCEGLGERDHEHVLVGLPVGKTRHRKQRDDGPVMRQCVHAAARHRSDAMEYLKRNMRLFCGRNEAV